VRRGRIRLAMASNPINPAYRKVEVDEFLDMEIGDAKAELVDGTIFMMSGGSEAHAAIAANIIIALGTKLRGSGCRPYGSDMAVRTGPNSIRFPDVSIYCSNPRTPGNAKKKLIGIPKVVFEVLSPSTASNDQIAKLTEYRALDGLETIIFVDPDNERVRPVGKEGGDDWLPTGADLALDALGVTLTHEEMFSLD
jgi:Uma2 family endonuclease